MGIKDNVIKNYMKDSAVFADAFNFYIYQGRPVIKPEDFKEPGSSESVIIYESGRKPYADSTDIIMIGKAADLYCHIDSTKQDKSAHSAEIINSVASSDNRHINPSRKHVYDS